MNKIFIDKIFINLQIKISLQIKINPQIKLGRASWSYAVALVAPRLRAAAVRILKAKNLYYIQNCFVLLYFW